MNSSLLAYVAIAALVFAAGWGLFRLVFADEISHTWPAPSPPSAAASMKSREPPVPKETDTSPVHLFVNATKGSVSRKDSDDQAWVDVEVGDRLGADESIRTSANGMAELAVNDASQVRLAGDSELKICDLTSSLHSVELRAGKLDVQYREEGRRKIAIRTPDHQTTAQSESGEFVIQNSRGRISVVSVSADVSLASHGKAVHLSPGTYSRTLPGQPPSAAAPIPATVMLRVARPNRTNNQVSFVTVKGKTTPDARVRVRGRDAPEDDDGRFKVRIPLQIGHNTVDVVAETAWGTARESLSGLSVIPPGEAEDAKIKWGKSH